MQLTWRVNGWGNLWISDFFQLSHDPKNCTGIKDIRQFDNCQTCGAYTCVLPLPVSIWQSCQPDDRAMGRLTHHHYCISFQAGFQHLHLVGSGRHLRLIVHLCRRWRGLGSAWSLTMHGFCLECLDSSQVKDKAQNKISSCPVRPSRNLKNINGN